MARFPDDEIDRLKRHVAVQRLAEGMGVKLTRHGQDLIGLCPFHDDREPSLVISPASNLWNCLGACQRGGSSIDWVMRQYGVSFRHAVELMRQDLAGVAEAAAHPPARSTVRRLPSPVAIDADDQVVLKQVVAFYHETLKQSPEALAYLEERGLRSAEMIDRFKLGYCNRTLCYRIPEKNREAGEAIRTRLQKLGLLRASGHEHFRGSIVVPVFDELGNVTEIYGRKVRDDLRKGTPLHLYLPGPHRGVWNVEALAASSEVILCEALFDALTFWCHGFRNVTASYGVCGFTEEHRAAFERYKTERVLIAYDRDEAGDKAAAELAAQLVAQGMACSRVQFPHGMDANEYVCKVKPPARALGVLVNGALWLGGPTHVHARAFSLVAAAKEERSEAPPTATTEHGPDTPPPAPQASPEADPEASLLEEPGLPEAKTAAAAAAPEAIAAAAGAGDELVMELEDRRYRVRGLPALLTYDHLHVNLFVSREGAAPLASAALPAGFHLERLDLYARPQRAAFAKEAAFELRLEEQQIKRDLGLLLLRIEAHLEERKKRQAEPPPSPAETMSEEERAAALELLKAPDLLARILEDFARCGIVGEETNMLMGYLAVISRKLEEPLAVVVQSSSAAGKSSLMDAVLSFVPPEDRVKYSAMTGQSLFYLGETDLKHKVLAIVEEAGAEKASYALKLLQSEKELTIASTGKDPETGKLVTQDYHVEGPVMIFLTTTAPEIDEELLNRSVVLTVNEEREQTRAIHQLQRDNETIEGVLAKRQRERLRNLHRNAQRLLRPLRVANPFAPSLTFLDDRTRTRRDQPKYLTLIRTIALLHQHQREVKLLEQDGGEPVEYVEVTLTDIAVANVLAHEVLGRSLDELAPQTRRLLVALDAMVRERAAAGKLARAAVRFSRRDVRERTGWSLEQVRVHLGRLVELEYLAVHHGRKGLSFEYELLYDGQGQDGRPFLSGLIDVAQLGTGSDKAHDYDANLPGLPPNLPGPEDHLPGTYRPLTGPLPGAYRTSSNGRSPLTDALLKLLPVRDPENTH